MGLTLLAQARETLSPSDTPGTTTECDPCRVLRAPGLPVDVLHPVLGHLHRDGLDPPLLRPSRAAQRARDARHPFTLATSAVHGFGFWFLDEQLVVGSQIFVPFLNGYVRHALGIVAFDLLVAIFVTAGMHRFFRYRKWLRFHQTAYVVFALGFTHAWWGAWSNGNLDLLWLAGLTVSAPALALAAVRFVPTGILVRIGLIEGDAVTVAPVDKAAPLSVSVDNQRCHRYGFCQSEAPDVFQLREDGRLAYQQSPEVSRNLDVISAARSCPMRAIQIAGRES